MGILTDISYGPTYMGEWAIGLWILVFIGLANNSRIKNSLISYILIIIGLLPLIIWLIPVVVVFFGVYVIAFAVIFLIFFIVIKLFIRESEHDKPTEITKVFKLDMNSFAEDQSKAHGAASILKYYYDSINNKKYDVAFDILSDEMKEQLGGYDSFLNKFKTMHSITVFLKNEVTLRGNTVTLNYILIYEELINDLIKKQEYTGTSILEFIDKRWKILDIIEKK